MAAESAGWLTRCCGQAVLQSDYLFACKCAKCQRQEATPDACDSDDDSQAEDESEDESD